MASGGIEKSTVSALIGAAIVFGGIAISTTKELNLSQDASTGILWASIIIGGLIVGTSLIPKVLRKR